VYIDRRNFNRKLNNKTLNNVTLNKKNIKNLENNCILKVICKNLNMVYRVPMTDYYLPISYTTTLSKNFYSY